MKTNRYNRSAGVQHCTAAEDTDPVPPDNDNTVTTVRSTAELNIFTTTPSCATASTKTTAVGSSAAAAARGRHRNTQLSSHSDQGLGQFPNKGTPMVCEVATSPLRPGLSLPSEVAEEPDLGSFLISERSFAPARLSVEMAEGISNGQDSGFHAEESVQGPAQISEKSFAPARLSIEVVEGISNGQDSGFHPEIAQQVVADTLTKESLVRMEPMKPKVGTVTAGYNPKLDQARPQELKEYLTTYRILFVIDDSGSMVHHWNETRDALQEIANYALEYSSDTVEISFFNNPFVARGVKGVQQLISIFNRVRPSGGTPTGHVLEKILGQQINRLDTAVRYGSYSSELPLDIIVLTDGVPNYDSPPAPVIEAAAERLKKSKHHPNWIGIQFVQIGDDSQAEPTLLSLIEGTNHNMVDTISYSFYKDEGGGRLTPAVLRRIILGGLHPNLRAYWNQWRQQKFEKTSNRIY